MKLTKLFLFTFAVLSFFVTVSPVRAFEISPVKALLTVDPDKNQTQTLVVKIKNNETLVTNTNFKLSVLGMKQDENGKPIFSRGVEIAESWVYPENNLINIKSGETGSGNFIIKIPKDAVSGSYYLGLAVEPVLEKNKQNNFSVQQSGLSTRLVSLLTLQVKGLVQESLVIEKWTANLVDEKENKKINFDLNLKNIGNIETAMIGSVGIKNWRGEEIFSEPIFLGNKLLANSYRVLHPEIILKNKINSPGIYSANIKINYGRTNQMISAVVYIWYFPNWSKIILLIAGLLVFCLIFWKFRKKKQ